MLLGPFRFVFGRSVSGKCVAEVFPLEYGSPGCARYILLLNLVLFVHHVCMLMLAFCVRALALQADGSKGGSGVLKSREQRCCPSYRDYREMSFLFRNFVFTLLFTLNVRHAFLFLGPARCWLASGIAVVVVADPAVTPPNVLAEGVARVLDNKLRCLLSHRNTRERANRNYSAPEGGLLVVSSSGAGKTSTTTVVYVPTMAACFVFFPPIIGVDYSSSADERRLAHIVRIRSLCAELG